MKYNAKLNNVIITAFVVGWLPCFCQPNQDSAMLANAEKYTAKQNKGIFGLAKPIFGIYATIDIIKIDSPSIKKKTKDSSFIGAQVFAEQPDLDQSKYITIEEKKYYKLLLGTASGTAEAVFAIASITHEKKQSLLGKVLSKNHEGKDIVLAYKRDVPGTIKTAIDSLDWKFFIGDFGKGTGQNGVPFLPAPSIGGGYLMNIKDSFYIQTWSSFSANIVLVDQKGEHLAALAFQQKHPDIWIRRNIETSTQTAIAAFFAVILGIKDF